MPINAIRPNILFVMTDDQTVREMSCNPGCLFSTPNMDRIAGAGTLFKNAFATNALCAPSRATVLTGVFSHIHGIRGNSEVGEDVEELDSGIATFPELLQAAGYQTALVGKYHIRQQPRGFDYWAIHPGQGVYFDPIFIENGVQVAKRGYATDITGDLALSFLEKRERDRPFCLLYQFKAPHRPFTPAPRHERLFEDMEIPEPETFHDDYSTRDVAAGAEDMKLEVSLAPDYPDLPVHLDQEGRKRWIYQRMMKDRMRTLVAVDENLGRVLDYLETEGLAEDTLVVYTSDHGYFLGEHGWYDKRFMYDPSIRIPLVTCYPRLCPLGAVSEALVMNVDFAPTILDFAGVPIPEAMQGKSLRGILQGTLPEDWRQSVYYEYFDRTWGVDDTHRPDDAVEKFDYFTAHRIGPHRGVRTDRYKLIEYHGEGGYWELFDLQSDPHELHNRYHDPLLSEIRASLEEELLRLRKLYRSNVGRCSPSP